MFGRKPSTRGKVISAGPSARRAPRHETNLVTCEYGEVADLSMSGMKVRCERKPPVKVGQVISLKLKSQEQRINATAKVIWIKRKGLRRCSMGLQFVNITPSLAAALESLAIFGFVDLEAVAEAKKKKKQDEEAKSGGKPSIRLAASLPDYYKILGLEPSATADQIRKAFRTLAAKYHPDVTKDPGGAKIFLEINEAHRMLGDPELRAAYDARHAA